MAAEVVKVVEVGQEKEEAKTALGFLRAIKT